MISSQQSAQAKIVERPTQRREYGSLHSLWSHPHRREGGQVILERLAVCRECREVAVRVCRKVAIDLVSDLYRRDYLTPQVKFSNGLDESACHRWIGADTAHVGADARRGGGWR